MLLVTTALSGLMAGAIQTAPPQTAPQTPPAAAPAATAPAVADDDITDLGTVDTTGARARGSVNSDIPPDVTLTAEQIQAYGAANIAELLTYLEPLTRSSRGRADGQPVFLVNGRRISGFQEIQGIPTEAIERTDILPEEVALQYGYRADQRVVNFVLKANFRSVSGELTGRAPTRGGRTTAEIEGNVLRIAGATRWSMDAEYERSTPLYESERDIFREPGATPDDLIDDLGAYRTLLSASERSTVRGTVKRDINGTTQGTISGSLQNLSSRGFNGLPGGVLTLPAGNPFSPFADDVLVFRYLDAADPLARETDTLTGRVAGVLDGYIGEDWRWTLTGSYDRIETDTFTGRGFDTAPFQARLTANDPGADPFGLLTPADFTRLSDDTASSVSQVLSAEAVLNGDVYDLPAGGVSSTFTFTADTRSLDSTSVRSGVTIDRSQSRDRFNGQASFGIPIASRRQGVLPALGDLSANFNVGYEELSDFGGLSTLGFGVNWSPIEPVSLLISYTDEHGAPTISQLNDPIVGTPNVPVFDFATGQTVFVTRIDGGNPDLNSDNRKVWKLGATLKPWSETDFRIQSTWTYSLTEDAIAAFPTLTPDLEAALPGRFVRDTGGNLVSFDARPLNFDRFERQDIRTGFNYSRAFGTPNPNVTPLPGMPGGARPAPGGAPVVIRQGGGDGPRGGPGGGMQMRMGGGGGRGGGMQPGQGRFNLSVYHTVRLQDEIVIADGLPVLDLLDGSATGSRGGTSRNEIQAQAGVFKSGMGAFLHGNWREGTRVDGGTGPDLAFSDLTTINLHVFIDLGGQAAWVEKYPWLKGSRVQFGVQNIFNSRLEVTSSAGDAPLNYQPDYLDPQGRTVSLTFRKILF
ncbi:MAG: TonB-dependent receptor plug domain-containing protein [Brevundimonas sp.]|uniref:TonB-dependent receptor plug domain-containing protein n=1 Tax=Brevundimonas sp. TaxID=1871086 RepID=UPI002489A345|nr:TonB-dependent receptor plug domain-containing protein [Brevundimonas sp.]MDI1326811.1 TonB-dependent receptor plug domain-containing protein [Brevundimonas sp.]